MLRLSIPAIVVAALFSSVGVSYAGPCTARIARVERQIRAARSNPFEGPSATQTIAAQLNHQPTPASVRTAERRADAAAKAALRRARRANANGNAAACNHALNRVRELYNIR